MVAFGESVAPTAAIASILGTYPFSIGILREILQNSDDAKATRQTFILDRRTHPRARLLHEALGDAQGPALLAYNDAVFQEDDWLALQLIHQSSKRTDTSKIGKYGIGFRSLYHVTDTPQIFSGNSFAVLDPHHDINDSGGVRVDVTREHGKCADHIPAFCFDHLAGGYVPGTSFGGTTVRLPLRRDGSRSKISSKTLTAEEIRQLFIDFVNEEIEIAMLFLSHISVIEILEVDEQGFRYIGKAEIQRRTLSLDGLGQKEERCTVTVHNGSPVSGLPQAREWHLLHTTFPTQECVDILSKRLNYDVAQGLAKEKLKPSISLAIPVPLQPTSSGRLFTFLPLPLPTGFPCHLHALFALTQARQNLWNCSERGIVVGTRDELLVEWNRVLFDTFIPRAWKLFLEALAPAAKIANGIFLAWPPSSQQTPGGDPAYWQHLPINLLRTLEKQRAAVWPLYIPTANGGNGGVARCPTFASLDTVLVAAESDIPYLSALTSAGVNIILPPPYIRQMLSQLGRNNALSPHTARSVILTKVLSIHSLSHADKSSILTYLLSTSDLRLITLIPIIPLTGGAYVALSLKNSVAEEYVLLKDDEHELFGTHTQYSITLSMLPGPVQTLFATVGSQVLNVVHLECAHVTQCLPKVFTSFNLPWRTESVATIPKAMLDWLAGFWMWLGSWPSRNSLIPFITHFDILPDSQGRLHSLTGVIFRAQGINSPTVAVLQTLGINFIDESFPSTATTFLESQGVVKSAQSIVALLEHIDSHAAQVLNARQLTTLHHHLVSCLGQSRQQLSSPQKSRLRTLMIYPLLRVVDQGKLASNIQFGSLPEGKKVICVDNQDASILNIQGSILLPTITDSVFVARFGCDNTMDTIQLLSHIDYQACTVLPELAIIQLFVDHFSVQPKRVQIAFLNTLLANLPRIPPQVFQTLRRISCVLVGTGTLRKAPEQVIDPESPIAQLFDPSDVRFPCLSTPEDRMIIYAFRSLKLLCMTLSDEIVKERISCIVRTSFSAAQPSDIPAQLLMLLENNRYDCNGIVNELRSCWLPTEQGLRRPQECRDHNSVHHRALFDRVLTVLQSPSPITSRSLRSALGWDNDISLTILKSQLDAELRAGAHIERLVVLLTELGRRVQDLQEAGLVNEFRELTSERRWIPTSAKGLSFTSRIVLDAQSVAPGFHRIPSKLGLNDGVLEFLRLMGCTERPSNASIIEELQGLFFKEPTLDNSRLAIRLLKLLDIPALTSEERSNVVIPGADCVLRELDHIYYDDLGVRAYQVELPADQFKVHGDVSTSLGTRLGIQSLGSLNLKQLDIDDEEQMEENLSTRINNVLRQYSVDQAFNEFLANAADAGATQYDILLDERTSPDFNILSSTMAQFQASPSLILHNNAVFKEEDYKGIRRVGLGGKQDRSDSIGKFGLGALSMFHFTEVAMIISGEHVVFLDPSKMYLPPNGPIPRSFLKIPLKNMRRIHGDHLESFSGLYGYTPEMDYYNGTLFRLPLRTSEQLRQSRLSKGALFTQDVKRLIVEYCKLAPQSLLFIKVSSITASHRDNTGHGLSLWSTVALRTDPKQEDEFMSHTITISSIDIDNIPQKHTWYIVSEQAGSETLPDDFKALITKHKLRSVGIAIAGLLSFKARNSKQPQFRLYSKLPLPTFTALPVHVDASFVLADDRRSIRFDEGGQTNLESQYNWWLLSHKIPLLYICLLQTWPTCPGNIHVFPGNTTTKEDPITRLIVDEFYSKHFPNSSRKFCESLTHHRLQPSQVVFLDCGSGMKSIIEALKPAEVVELPHRVRTKVLSQDVTVINRTNAQFLRKMITRDNARFVAAYERKMFSVQNVQELLLYMLESDKDMLLGLPVLPLANGNLGVVSGPTAPKLFGVSFHSTSSWRPWELFPIERFLHPTLTFEKFLNHELNICAFSGDQIVELIKDIIPSEQMRTLTLQKQDWVKSFWTHFTLLNIGADTISHYPLVPTTQSGVYVSLQYCKDSTVFEYRHEHEEWLWRILKKLGAVLVDKEMCPRQCLLSLPSLDCSFERVLTFMETLGPQRIPQLFTGVSTLDHIQFAEYARQRIGGLRKMESLSWTSKKKRNRQPPTYKVDHLDIARQLPIWVASRDNNTLLLPGSDSRLKMLPSLISLTSTRRFLSSTSYYVGFNTDLNMVLGVKPLEFASLVEYLNFPSVLTTDEEFADFKAILSVMILNNAQIEVPNSNGVMVNGNTLYAHSQPLFVAALGRRQERFVHPSLQSLESQLSAFGLHVRVDFASFKECARAVALEFQETGHATGASEVYQWYNEHLWTLVVGNETLWSQVDKIRFIPRNDIRRNLHNPTFSPVDYAQVLPSIVSPDEVLRSEHETVAWTQRALFRDPPSQRLLLANMELGVPSAKDVVEHLRVLVQIAHDHPMNSDVLSDLSDTYRRLKEQRSECYTYLLSYKSEKLFLNVDDPSSTSSWRFSAAQQLVFNAPDEGERQSVCDFLMQFKDLLLLVGANQIKDAVRPPLNLSPAEEVLVRLRSSLNQQRQSGQLTDVTLESLDGQTFQAHRNILAAATDHFEIMFCRGWRDSMGSVKVETTGDALKHMLEYIYLGTLQEIGDQDNLLELLELSQMWDLRDLFERVQNQLISTITLGTFEEVQEIAEKYDAKQLLEACEKYKIDNAHAL